MRVHIDELSRVGHITTTADSNHWFITFEVDEDNKGIRSSVISGGAIRANISVAFPNSIGDFLKGNRMFNVMEHTAEPVEGIVRWRVNNLSSVNRVVRDEVAICTSQQSGNGTIIVGNIIILMHDNTNKPKMGSTCQCLNEPN